MIRLSLLLILGASIWWTFDNVLHVNDWLDYMAVITQPDPDAETAHSQLARPKEPLEPLASLTVERKFYKPGRMTDLERHKAILYLFAEE